jgi:hypothetical protein
MRAAALAIVVAAAASPTRADDAHARGAIAGVKVGGIVPFDGLSPFVAFGVELGYRLGHVVIALDVDYTQPSRTGIAMDPRVVGGSYTWKLVAEELAIMPVAWYRANGSGFVPYVGIGPRVMIVRSTVRDNGAPAIAGTTETSTSIGVGVPVGADVQLGPGAAIAELLVQYGRIDHAATGPASTAAATVSVGYRISF